MKIYKFSTKETKKENTMKHNLLLLLILLFQLAITVPVEAEMGDEVTWIGPVAYIDDIITMPLSSNQYVTFYEVTYDDFDLTQKVEGIVATVDENLNITYGTKLEIFQKSVDHLTAARLSETQFIFAFRHTYDVGPDTTFFYVGTVSGSGAGATISLDVEHNIENTQDFSLTALSSTQFVMAYKQYNGITELYDYYARIGTIAADSIRIGSPVKIDVFNNDGRSGLTIITAALSSTKFVITGAEGTESSNYIYKVATATVVSEDEITCGTAETIFTNSDTLELYNLDLVALSADKFVVEYLIYNGNVDVLSEGKFLDSFRRKDSFSPFVSQQSNIELDLTGYVAVKLGTVNGADITLGDQEKIWDYFVWSVSLAKISAAKFTASFINFGKFTPDYLCGIAVVGEVDGSSLTWHSKFKCTQKFITTDEFSTIVVGNDKLIAVYEYEAEDSDENYGVAVPSSLGEMSYTSCATVQQDKVLKGFENQAVLKIQIGVDDPYNPLVVTQFVCNANGTTNLSEISNARIWYSEWGSTLNDAQQFGETVADPSGTLIFNGSQQLAAGVNNFWLTFDISKDAIPGNLADGQCTSITVDGMNRTPSPTSPGGSAVITYPRTFLAEHGKFESANGLYVQEGMQNGKPYYHNTQTDTSHVLYFLNFNNMDIWLIGTSFDLLNTLYYVRDETGNGLPDPPCSGWDYMFSSDSICNLSVNEVFENGLMYSANIFATP